MHSCLLVIKSVLTGPLKAEVSEVSDNTSLGVSFHEQVLAGVCTAAALNAGCTAQGQVTMSILSSWQCASASLFLWEFKVACVVVQGQGRALAEPLHML